MRSHQFALVCHGTSGQSRLGTAISIGEDDGTLALSHGDGRIVATARSRRIVRAAKQECSLICVSSNDGRLDLIGRAHGQEQRNDRLTSRRRRTHRSGRGV